VIISLESITQCRPEYFVEHLTEQDQLRGVLIKFKIDTYTISMLSKFVSTVNMWYITRSMIPVCLYQCVRLIRVETHYSNPFGVKNDHSWSKHLGSPLHQKQVVFNAARCLETAFLHSYILRFNV